MVAQLAEPLGDLSESYDLTSCLQGMRGSPDEEHSSQAQPKWAQQSSGAACAGSGRSSSGVLVVLTFPSGREAELSQLPRLFPSPQSK